MDLIRLLNQPGHDYKLIPEGVSIRVPSKLIAQQLARKYEAQFLETAFKLKGTVKIGWKRCKQPLEIHGWMAQQEKPTAAETAQAILSFQGTLMGGTIYCGQARCPIELLKRNIAAAESEKPVGITRHHDGKLVMINQPLEILKQTPAPEACALPVAELWRPADFAELQRKYELFGRFDWAYDAALNPHLWAELETSFERFKAEDGLWYGINIINYAQPVPFPADVVLSV
jgi:hypothetical protein